MHISNNAVRYLTALIPNGHPVYGGTPYGTLRQLVH